MRCYVLIGNDRYELEDTYALQEPLVNTTWFFQKENEQDKKRYTIVKVDNIFVVSGKSLDVIKEITLE